MDQKTEKMVKFIQCTYTKMEKIAFLACIPETNLNLLTTNIKMLLQDFTLS